MVEAKENNEFYKTDYHANTNRKCQTKYNDQRD